MPLHQNSYLDYGVIIREATSEAWVAHISLLPCRGKLLIELLVLPVGKDNFERLWQDGEPGAVIQAGKVVFVLIGG